MKYFWHKNWRQYCTAWSCSLVGAVVCWKCAHYFVKTARDLPQLVFTGILCVLQWDHGVDSCLCYVHWSHGLLSFRAMSHLMDSTVALWQTPSVRKSTSGWPHPCSYPPPSSLLRAARSAVAPVYRPHSGPLTHPSVSPAGDGRGRFNSQARSGEWPHSHYSGLAPCHYF